MPSHGHLPWSRPEFFLLRPFTALKLRGIVSTFEHIKPLFVMKNFHSTFIEYHLRRHGVPL